MENPGNKSAESVGPVGDPPPPAQDQSTSESLQDSAGQQQQRRPPPPLSPLTGCYLLVVVGEPHSDRHKEIILQKIAKAFLSWDVSQCHVSLEKELQVITGQSPEGEEARYGERLIQYATENLVTEILIHPQLNTVHQCMKNLLSSFTKHRHIIHAGYTFAGNGSWILQDGTLSILDLVEALHEPEVLRVLKAYENSVSIDIHCAPEGDWTTERFHKEPVSKLCTIRVNPGDVMTAGNPAISAFIDYLSPFLEQANIQQLLQPTDVVGNIRFTHPTLYVFPGGQGDAALFGINGFNMLIDGGFARKACFWDFARHLDRLDAVLLTRLNNSTVNGISAVLRRKKMNHVYPQIGHFFCNLQDRKIALSPDGDKDKDSLIVNLAEEGQEIVANLRHLALKPHPCYRDGNQVDPVNLYHKVGHGKLDMYVISPARDSQAVKEFLAKWSSNDTHLFSNTGKKMAGKAFEFPLQNLVSICALLVWQPANPNDTITRILFPGSTPQHKIFEGLEKLRHLEFLKHPVCSARSISPSASAVAVNRSVSKTRQSKPVDNKQKEVKPVSKPQVKAVPKPKIEKAPPLKPKPDTNKLADEKVESEVVVEERLKKLENRIFSKDEQIENIKKEIQKIEQAENEEQKKKIVHRSKYDMRNVKSKVDSRAPSKSIDRKKVAEKKPEGETSPPATPKKNLANGTATKAEKAKTVPRTAKAPSPTATPAKSAKEANNRKVVEARGTSRASGKSVARKKEETPPPVPSGAPAKVEKKPIGRRPKTSLSPAKSAKGAKPEPDSAPKKIPKRAEEESVAVKALGQKIREELETEKTEKKEGEQEIKIEIKKLEGERTENKETDLLAVNHQQLVTVQSRESTKEEEEEEEEEEYLIVTKEESTEEEKSGKENEEEEDGEEEEVRTKDETEGEGEIKKLLREEEESEKKRDVGAQPEEKIDDGKEEVEKLEEPEEKIEDDVAEKEYEKEEKEKIVEEEKDAERRESEVQKLMDVDEGIDLKEPVSKEPREGESLPEEKISNTLETSATTAPTLPEDERIEEPAVEEEKEEEKEGEGEEKAQPEETKEVVEEKYIQEKTKEDKAEEKVEVVPEAPLTPPDAADVDVEGIPAPASTGQRKHPRDVVKTPDEVADLPMHEEVDPRMYSSVEFTRELQKKPEEEEEDEEEEKEKSPEEKPQKLDFKAQDKGEANLLEEEDGNLHPEEPKMSPKEEEEPEKKAEVSDARSLITSKYLDIIDELEKSVEEPKKNETVEEKPSGEKEEEEKKEIEEKDGGKSPEPTPEESAEDFLRKQESSAVEQRGARQEEEEGPGKGDSRAVEEMAPTEVVAEEGTDVTKEFLVESGSQDVDRISCEINDVKDSGDDILEKPTTENLSKDPVGVTVGLIEDASGKATPQDLVGEMSEKITSQDHDQPISGKSTPLDIDKNASGKTTPQDLEKPVSGKSTPLDIERESSGKITPQDQERPISGKSTPLDIEKVASGKSTPQDLEKPISGKSTPLEIEIETSGKITPQGQEKSISGKSTPLDIEKESSGKITPQDLEKQISGKSTPLDIQRVASGKSSPQDLEKPISGKSTPLDIEKNASGKITPQDQEKPISGKSTPLDTDRVTSGKSTPQDLEKPISGKSTPLEIEIESSGKITPQDQEKPISGKSTPLDIKKNGSGKSTPLNLTEEVPGKITTQDLEKQISGKSTPLDIERVASGKSTPQDLEKPISGKSTPLEIEIETSGKITPQDQEKSISGKSTPLDTERATSGKSTPQDLEKPISGKSTPLDIEREASGKITPHDLEKSISEEDVQLVIEKDASGKSTPQDPVKKASGKSTPLDFEQETTGKITPQDAEKQISGKSTPLDIEGKISGKSSPQELDKTLHVSPTVPLESEKNSSENIPDQDLEKKMTGPEEMKVSPTDKESSGGATATGTEELASGKTSPQDLEKSLLTQENGDCGKVTPAVSDKTSSEKPASGKSSPLDEGKVISGRKTPVEWAVLVSGEKPASGKSSPELRKSAELNLEKSSEGSPEQGTKQACEKIAAPESEKPLSGKSSPADVPSGKISPADTETRTSPAPSALPLSEEGSGVEPKEVALEKGTPQQVEKRISVSGGEGDVLKREDVSSGKTTPGDLGAEGSGTGSRRESVASPSGKPDSAPSLVGGETKAEEEPDKNLSDAEKVDEKCVAAEEPAKAAPTPSAKEDTEAVPGEEEVSCQKKVPLVERSVSDSADSGPGEKDTSGKSTPFSTDRETSGKMSPLAGGKVTSDSFSLALAEKGTSGTYSLEKGASEKSSSPSPVDISPLSLDELKETKSVATKEKDEDGGKREEDARSPAAKKSVSESISSRAGKSPLERVKQEAGGSSGASSPDGSHQDKSEGSLANGVESEEELEKGTLESERQEKESQILDISSGEEEELKALGDDEEDLDSETEIRRERSEVEGGSDREEIRKEMPKGEKDDINKLVKIAGGGEAEDPDNKAGVRRMLVTASSEDGGTETEICLQSGIKAVKENITNGEDEAQKEKDGGEEFSHLILQARKEYNERRSRKTSYDSTEEVEEAEDAESVAGENGNEEQEEEEEELGNLVMQARQELAFVRSKSRELKEIAEPKMRRYGTTETSRMDDDIITITTILTEEREEQEDGTTKVTTTKETTTTGGKKEGTVVTVSTKYESKESEKAEEKEEEGSSSQVNSGSAERRRDADGKTSQEEATETSRRTSASSIISQEDLVSRKDSAKIEDFRQSSSEMSPLKTTYITSHGDSESLMTSSFYGNLPTEDEMLERAEHAREFRKGRGYESFTEIGPNGERTERTYFYGAEEEPARSSREKTRFVKAYYSDEGQGQKEEGEQSRFVHRFYASEIPEEEATEERTRIVQRFYAEGPGPAEGSASPVDFAKAVDEHVTVRGEFLGKEGGKYVNGRSRAEARMREEQEEEEEGKKQQVVSSGGPKPEEERKKDVIEEWGKPLGLPLPPKNKSYSFPGQNISTTSSLSTPTDNSDSVTNWGQPMSLPSPAPPLAQNGVVDGLTGKAEPAGKETPKKEKKPQPKKNFSGDNKSSGNNTPNRRSESPVKQTEKRAPSAGRSSKQTSNSYLYLDLTYVPHHGNSYYSNVEFFKKVRARYYVFSGTEPSKEVYNALLEAKQTWEDKKLEVTIIPTYDTDVLGYWVAENEETLARHKIDLSPSASRCTINLQDHETSCSAYRLEF